MPRLFLYLIIVLFPKQNTIAKVAEKAKRVACVCVCVCKTFSEKRQVEDFMKTAKSQTPFIEAANFGPSIEIRCVCVCVCVGDRQKKYKSRIFRKNG